MCTLSVILNFVVKYNFSDLRDKNISIKVYFFMCIVYCIYLSFSCTLLKVIFHVLVFGPDIHKYLAAVMCTAHKQCSVTTEQFTPCSAVRAVKDTNRCIRCTPDNC